MRKVRTYVGCNGFAHSGSVQVNELITMMGITGHFLLWSPVMKEIGKSY